MAFEGDWGDGGVCVECGVGVGDGGVVFVEWGGDGGGDGGEARVKVKRKEEKGVV